MANIIIMRYYGSVVISHTRQSRTSANLIPILTRSPEWARTRTVVNSPQYPPAYSFFGLAVNGNKETYY